MSRLHDLTLGDVLRENRRSYPGKAALVCGSDRHTYPAMDDRVNRLANALLADGVGRGDRVLWLGQNCHRVLEALLAAAKIGAVFCPVNWRQTAATKQNALNSTSALPSAMIIHSGTTPASPALAPIPLARASRPVRTQAP